jgi:hypothetical protein
MATRLRLELDPESFGRLMQAAVAERRSADWQAEVILRRALGTWEEPRTGYAVPDLPSIPKPATVEREAARAPA